MQKLTFKNLTLPLFFVLAGCQSHDKVTELPVKTVDAQVVTLNAQPMSIQDAAPGAVVAEQQVQVASRLMGYIRSIAVHEGDVVKKGQLLFTIDSSDIEGQVAQAQAGSAQAVAALNDAKLDYERFSNLYKEESIPKLQYDKIKLQYSIAQSQSRAANAALTTAASQLHYAQVRAPIDGVVTQKLSHEGDLAAPGSPVLVLENTKKLLVQTTVGDVTYEKLKLGDAAVVEVAGVEKPLQGIIVRLVPAADITTHTHLIKLDLSGATGLTSGSFARVKFNIGSKAGLSLPKSAIMQRAGITGVFVVDEQGIAHYRMVRTGFEAGDTVEIAAGLNSGERVVVATPAELESGDHVHLTEGKTP